MRKHRISLLILFILSASSIAKIAAEESLPEIAAPEFAYEPLTASFVRDAASTELPVSDECSMVSFAGGASSDEDQRIARLEAELDEIRRSLQGKVVRSPQAVFAPPCPVCNKLYGAIEVTLLRPRVSGAMPAFFGANGGRTIDNHFGAGTRFILGHRNEKGLGIRGRYWSYNDGFNYAPPNTPAVLTINAEAADAEVTQLQHLGYWNLAASGGIRYSKFGYSSNILGPFGVGEAYFEGLGPTVSLDARRPIGQSEFAFVGNVRGALLFGEIRNSSMLLSVPQGVIRDEVAQTFENQLGLSWTRAFINNSQVEISTVWETQYWMSDTLADDSLGIGSNLGFMGPTIAVEFRY